MVGGIREALCAERQHRFYFRSTPPAFVFDDTYGTGRCAPVRFCRDWPRDLGFVREPPGAMLAVHPLASACGPPDGERRGKSTRQRAMPLFGEPGLGAR